MMQNTWKLFPRLIEQKINGLLAYASPNRMKAYQIYKTCQNENLFRQSFADFNIHLSHYFELELATRSKSHFDSYLERPMHKSIFELFKLDFRTAEIGPEEIRHISSWTHNMMRLNCQISDCLISIDMIQKSLEYITSPPLFEKSQEIDFDDFCSAWKKTVFQFFGHRYDPEVSRVLKELHLLQLEQKRIEQLKIHQPLISLTQTELDWTVGVQQAVTLNTPLPFYPLTRGPQKPALQQIEKIVQLYNLIMCSTKNEFIEQQINVRTTLLYRCQELLNRSRH